MGFFFGRGRLITKGERGRLLNAGQVRKPLCNSLAFTSLHFQLKSSPQGREINVLLNVFKALWFDFVFYGWRSFSFELIKMKRRAQQEIYYWPWKNKSRSNFPRGEQIETKNCFNTFLTQCAESFFLSSTTCYQQSESKARSEIDLEDEEKIVRIKKLIKLLFSRSDVNRLLVVKSSKAKIKVFPSEPPHVIRSLRR